MRLVEKSDRGLFEQSDQEQTPSKSSDVSEPGDSAPVLAKGYASLKNLKDKIKSQNKSGRDVHHPDKEAQKNQNQDLCPWIKQDIGT